ncbi:MAG TPA: type I methionyl aminopeptidase [Vicinamibacterales bacterium]|jgi:methionyl aminopeptidase
MSIDSDSDWKGLRAAGEVVRLTLEALQERARAGVSTAELDAVAADLFARHSARSAPALVYGFPGTVLISVNDEVVHGVPGPRRLRRGDLVKLDVTVEKDGYFADAARTVVIEEDSASGGMAARRDVASSLRTCARAAFNEALTVARAGHPVSRIGRIIEREVRRRGFHVVRALAGHGTGRSIHEEPQVPNYFERRQTDILTEGLVIAIEPIISAGAGTVYEDADGWTIRTRDGSLAAHYENTVVITKGEPMIVTAA